MRAFERFLPFQPITFSELSDRGGRRGGRRRGQGRRKRDRGKAQKPLCVRDWSFILRGVRFNGVLSDAPTWITYDLKWSALSEEYFNLAPWFLHWKSLCFLPPVHLRPLWGGKIWAQHRIRAFNSIFNFSWINYILRPRESDLSRVNLQKCSQGDDSIARRGKREISYSLRGENSPTFP